MPAIILLVTQLSGATGHLVLFGRGHKGVLAAARATTNHVRCSRFLMCGLRCDEVDSVFSLSRRVSALPCRPRCVAWEMRRSTDLSDPGTPLTILKNIDIWPFRWPRLAGARSYDSIRSDGVVFFLLPRMSTGYWSYSVGHRSLHGFSDRVTTGRNRTASAIKRGVMHIQIDWRPAGPL